jgi:hypothetical protein
VAGGGIPHQGVRAQHGPGQRGLVGPPVAALERGLGARVPGLLGDHPCLSVGRPRQPRVMAAVSRRPHLQSAAEPGTPPSREVGIEVVILAGGAVGDGHHVEACAGVTSWGEGLAHARVSR